MAPRSSACITPNPFDMPLSRYVLQTLLYADIFRYPLTSHEVYRNLIEKKYSESEVQDTLSLLSAGGYIYQHDFLYSLHQDNVNCASRKDRNERAAKYMVWAKRISKFIAAFPYVRAIFLSGSLSKNCMDKDGDIDYFIITAPGRLWIARTALILFKKIFLFNSYKFFCLNYFIDESNLEIKHQNIYTATELLTLIPTYNPSAFKSLLEANQWAIKIRPNHPVMHWDENKALNKHYFKRIIEWLLKGKFGDGLDNLFRTITAKHWNKKFSNFSDQDYNLAIQSEKHTSQINPENFQKKVIQAYKNKITAFEKAHDVSLI